MLHIVNGSDKSTYRRRYLFSFGAYGWTQCLVWANYLEDALDEAVDWIAEHAPGLLCDAQVREAYAEAMASGLSEDEAIEKAEIDMTRAGNEGHYIASWEWRVTENPSRALLKSLAQK